MAKKTATKRKRPSELQRVEAKRDQVKANLMSALRQEKRVKDLPRQLRGAMRRSSDSLAALRDDLNAREDAKRQPQE